MPRATTPRPLSRIVIVIVAVLGLLASFAAFSFPARAGPCDQVGGVITGDWTVSNAQVCSGILYTVDGTITINAGGSLTLVNGGLKFAMDASHKGYALIINAGGELILDHSVVTTQIDAIAPYIKLPLTVSGHLAMTNGATLRFPGWFNATGATLDVSDSTITGFPATDVSGLGLYPDDNDDGPVIDWAGTTASLYRARIERIYENASAASDPNATGIIAGNVALRGGSSLYAYDSYLGVDFSNVLGLHNELQVDGSSNAYLYGGTVDRTQDPVARSDWRPAYRPLAAGGSIYLLRWLRLTAVDKTGFPVSGATVVSILSPSATPAQYPDNGFGPVPNARTIAYLGRSSGNPPWDMTDSSGLVTIPLYTDQVTTASLPNADSFGNYQMTVTFSAQTTTGGVNFDAYPATAEIDNTKWVTVPFPNLLVRTSADLVLEQSDYSGTLPVTQGQSFQVNARIYNRGQTGAPLVSIAAYLNGNRAAPALGRVDSLSVGIGGAVNTTITVTGIGLLGTQSLMLYVDPDNAIIEGGVAQEANNFANVTLNVQPPPNGFAAILSPGTDQTVEPGTALSVSGYLRDANGAGIQGIPVTIELRSGSSPPIATNVTTSDTTGFFIGTLSVPAGTPDGSFLIIVTPASSSVTPDNRAIAVKTSVPFLFTPILGLAVWMWLIIVIGAAAAIGGGTAYVKFVGLGKLVECGECGSFIRGDAAKCPKCGVEFEKGMAKCSNCQTWIPVDVKQCPECGVEFATGEVEMADYQAQMRRQYDDVKRKFREEASRLAGRPLTDREFEDWWRTKPTYMTFDDWLKDEEMMRRAGSKACPTCNTLNSVTAVVCHKCGSLMNPPQERPRPPAATRSEAPPAQAVPPKVTTKKVATPAPVVQRPPPPPASEGQQGGTGSTTEESKSDDDI